MYIEYLDNEKDKKRELGEKYYKYYPLIFLKLFTVHQDNNHYNH
jgi:hypothetical protein